MTSTGFRNVMNCVVFITSKAVFTSETKAIVAFLSQESPVYLFQKDSFACKNFATEMT